MPATVPTVLSRVMEAIAENLATVEVIAGGGVQLFGGNGTPADWNVPDGPERQSRVYFGGEPVPLGGPFPLCIIRFEDEEFDDLDQTTRRGMTLGWNLEVVFDINPLTEPDAHPTLRDMHTNLIRQIKDHFGIDANRLLPLAGFGSTVVDNRYQGGGARLIPLDEDAEYKAGSARYAFTLRYELIYRHAPGESITPV